MKIKTFTLSLLSTLFSLPSLATENIRISTANTDLILQVSPKGRLYQVYYGDKLLSDSDFDAFNWATKKQSTDGSLSERGWEIYAGAGMEDFFEPAIAITHNDGNQSTCLYYKSSEILDIEGGTETIIRLSDNKYPVDVVLHYAAYEKEDVIKTWSEISHQEKRPIHLWRYASTILYIRAQNYFLTQYHSDWASEGQPATQQLQFGKKVIESKLGSRAAEYMEPFFELGIDGAAQENKGEVVLGTLGWCGNFQLNFEIDNVGTLRIVPSINPFASNYSLKAGDVFTTPEFIFTRSTNGTSQASRNLHNWARLYELKDGTGDRLTLLNNWENTAFNFDQDTLAKLMKDAKDLGVDMFLLDDGWFANKYPRQNDAAGLGDWQPNASKLPDGIAGLTSAADEAGVKFGIWIEPEMVNPKSELYENHPDWAIQLPNRETYYYRNQLVLDLSNPKVQDYVFGVVDKILTDNPKVAYFKWDCNSPITNVYSSYLKENQGNLYIDHVRGVYNVMKRVKEKYPSVPMMLCSGGGARCDYESLKYFTEFWCSDNTDPYDRLFIQWSMSKFFPAKAMAAHVTNWNWRSPIKFRVDVASMCKLGFDIDLKNMSTNDYQFCQQAVKTYNSLKPTILDGNQYRLISPYETQHMALNYVNSAQTEAVLFTYDLHPRHGDIAPIVRLQGLDPQKRYSLTEVNLKIGESSKLPENGKTFSGDFLMKCGIDILSSQEATSHVIVLRAE